MTTLTSEWEKRKRRRLARVEVSRVLDEEREKGAVE